MNADDLVSVLFTLAEEAASRAACATGPAVRPRRARPTAAVRTARRPAVVSPPRAS